MINLLKKRNFIKVFILLFFILSCTEKTDPEGVGVDENIVGEPILETAQQVFVEENQTEDNNSIVVLGENNASLDSMKVLEEGLVVNGQAKPNDQNISGEKIVTNLPPLEEGSEYQLLAFRDMMNFEYLVDWEKDGKEFNFSSYSQRVPKRLRAKSGKKVAIEGFMIPTVVDENNEVKEFLLLPDQMSCCFGQTPEANGWVVVSANDGVEVMMDRIIRVTGQLTVEERWDTEFFVGLYHMTCEEITGPAL
ncbi:MAG: hypothetical protein CBC04_05740 [Verrucomicrobia bacterium TMED44]|nr:MAG: hypothetical protein CBC04_05740 [Verrucomicrobia bacterium TMED44]